MTIVNIRPGTRWQVNSRGVTPAELDAAVAVKQPLDSTLTGLAGLDAGAGLVEQTGADTFTKRALGIAATTSVPTRADADARYAVKATEADLDVAEATLSTLYSEVATARSGAASLDVRIDGIATMADSAVSNASFVELRDEVVSARSGAVDLDDRIDSIDNDVDAILSEISTARSGAASLDIRLDSLETDLEVRAALISWDRPADNLKFFTSTVAGGDAEAFAPIEASQLVWTDEGQAVKLTDPPDGIDYARIAVRHKFYLESARRYRVRWMVKREVNAPDPINDAIVPKLAWYESTLGAATPATTSLTPLAYTTGDGWNTISTVIARAAATGVDHVAPAAARFCTPFLDAFGETQQTNVVLIDFEPLETEFFSPDLDALEAEVDALQSIDAGNRLDVLEAYHAAPDTQSFEIKNDLVAATIGATVNQVTLHGWDAIDDGQGALLTREASEPLPIYSAWQPNTAYELLDTVINDNRKIYVCIGDGTSAVIPATGPAGSVRYIIDGSVIWSYVGLDDEKAQSADGAWWQVAPKSLHRNTFQNLGAGAQIRDADVRLSDTVHLLDYIPQALHANILTYTSTDDVIDYVDAAINSRQVPAGGFAMMGPRLILPLGKIYISRPIEIRCTMALEGQGSANMGDNGHNSVIEVAADQNGIIVHSERTYDEDKAAVEWRATQLVWNDVLGVVAGISICTNDGGKIYRCVVSGTTASNVDWAPNAAMSVGTRRKNVENNSYVVVSVTGDAKTAASGGPMGTGTGIVDNNVTWDYESVAGGPTGTGTGIQDGSAVWDYSVTSYQAGDVRWGYGTDARGTFSCICECISPGAGISTVEPNLFKGDPDTTLADGYTWRFLYDGRGSSGGTTLRNFSIRSLGGTAYKHGVWIRSGAQVWDVNVSGFPGNGINIVATTSFGLLQDGEGNANRWRVYGGRVTGCGHHGMFVDGSDANAGMAFNADCSLNNGWGFYDDSFLGNTYIGCHTNSNGQTAERQYDRFAYICVNEALGPTTPPGSDSSVWWFYATIGGSYADTITDWLSGTTYVAGALGVGSLVEGPTTHGVYRCTVAGAGTSTDEPDHLSGGFDYPDGYSWILQNAAPIWILNDPVVAGGCFYMEKSLLIASYAEAGQPAYLGTAALGMFPGFAIGNLTENSTGQYWQQGTTFMNFEQYDADRGGPWLFTIGGPPPTDTIWSFQHPVAQPSTIRMTMDRTLGDLSWEYSLRYYLQTLQTTTHAFGRSAPVPGAFYVDKLFVGPSTLTGARQITNALAMPTTGDWAAGDLVLNGGPTLGEPFAWRCIASGTPGTWQPLRDLGSQQTHSTTAALTLTPGTSPYRTLHNADIPTTANVILSITGALNGISYRITRAGTGAGVLNVYNVSAGGTLLKSMPNNSWCEVAYNDVSGAWYLSAYGTL